MWKKLLTIAIITITLLACGKKNENVEQAIVTTDSRFFPVPDFTDLFATLDYLQRADFDNVIPEKYHTDISDVYIASFYLGNLTADAIIATKARNKTKLSAIAHAMIEYSKMIGVNEEVLKLADDLIRLIQQDQWEELQLALDKYKVQVELSLYDTRQFDLMTLVQAGGWTEGINVMSDLLLQNYKTEMTSVLNQKGIVDNLVKNLKQMENIELYDLEWFKSLTTGFDKIYSIVNVQGKETFTDTEVKDLYTISSGIKSGLDF